MLEDLSEKLITHHVGGAWRAPYSGRMRSLRPPAGGPVIASLAEADARDLARAMHHADTGAAALAAIGQAARDRIVAGFLDGLRARVALLAAARALERGTDTTAVAEEEVADMLRAMQHALSAPLPTPAPDRMHATVILGTAAGPLATLGAALVEHLRAGSAIILKPAPRAPVVPLALMDALAAAGPPGGAVCLLQGGGTATGAPLLADPRITQAVLAGKAPARAALAAAARAGGVRLDCRATSTGVTERPG